MTPHPARITDGGVVTLRPLMQGARRKSRPLHPFVKPSVTILICLCLILALEYICDAVYIRSILLWTYP